MNKLINFMRYSGLYRWIKRTSALTGAILDFGCGQGELVLYLRQKNQVAYGVDTDLKDSQFTPFALCGNNLFSSLTDLKTNFPKDFAAIILNFSLEHCQEPVLMLRKLHGLLKPQGGMFIRVPNFAYLSKNHRLVWFQSKIHQKLNCFTAQTLQAWLEQAGFTVIKTDTRFCLTQALTPGCSLFPGLNPMTWFYRKKSPSWLFKAVALTILCVIFLPYTFLKSQMGQGAVLYALAKKSA